MENVLRMYDVAYVNKDRVCRLNKRVDDLLIVSKRSTLGSYKLVGYYTTNTY